MVPLPHASTPTNKKKNSTMTTVVTSQRYKATVPSLTPMMKTQESFTKRIQVPNTLPSTTTTQVVHSCKQENNTSAIT